MIRLSKNVRKRAISFLKKTPYFGEKRGQYYKYDLPKANRILYSIISKNPPIVRIVCIGNHNHYMNFLKTHGK